jgi:hypothetical protein
MPFTRAHRNFFRAAHDGLGAELHWLLGPDRRAGTITAADLCRQLLPEAAAALEAAGVDHGEVASLLGVIEARLSTGQTGAVWQRRTVAALEPRVGRESALARMLERYLELASTGRPVHTWPVTEPVGPPIEDRTAGGSAAGGSAAGGGRVDSSARRSGS